ncbi:MAG: hypothetical protein IPG23_11695 [Burkholderiales bacterium]|nr:hypothetical protein [Burkholderiales bacterium]
MMVPLSRRMSLKWGYARVVSIKHPNNLQIQMGPRRKRIKADELIQHVVIYAFANHLLKNVPRAGILNSRNEMTILPPIRRTRAASANTGKRIGMGQG